MEGLGAVQGENDTVGEVAWRIGIMYYVQMEVIGAYNLISGEKCES